MHEEASSSTPQAAPDNLYAPQKSVVADMARAESAPEFYVVESGKLLILFFGTLGMYQVYWFWKHWPLQRDRHKLDVWPIPRTSFSIFFAHALNARITQRLAQREIAYAWSPGSWATLYVICTILGNVLDRMSFWGIGWPTVGILSLALLLPAGASLLYAQRAANLGCDDPEGVRNEHLTVVNYLWLVFGGLLWIMVLFGLMISPEELA